VGLLFVRYRIRLGLSLSLINEFHDADKRAENHADEDEGRSQIA
jgi:hypothetical protein